MRLNKILRSILNSLNLKEKPIIKEDYVETIGEVPVSSIVVGFEYIENDVGLSYRFRVEETIQQDENGTWTWLALNLETQTQTPIICTQQGKAYWPKIIAA